MTAANQLARLVGSVVVVVAAQAFPSEATAAPLGHVAALQPVSAEPIGPGEDTERRTHCAQPAPLTANPADFPAGHRLLNVAQAWRFSRGAGVSVAVIDTGVTPHPRLPRLTGGGDYVADGDGLTDCDLHGTLIAGIIGAAPSPADDFAGVAPDASIISIRQSSGAYSANARLGDPQQPNVGAGFGPLSTLARAIVRAVDLGAKVINISETACAPTRFGINDDAIASALEVAARKDVVVVVAAGNVASAGDCREQNATAPATLATPARFGTDILTVGAVDAESGSPAEFSLHGPWVTVAGPGTAIVSAGNGRLVDAIAGDESPRPVAGTSYSTAYVSGTVALVRARYPQLRAPQVIERIIRTARGGAAGDPAVGYGVVDPVAALTADLPLLAALPDPARAQQLSPPQFEPESHLAAIAVAAIGALGVGLVAAVYAISTAVGGATRSGRAGARAGAQRSASPRRS